MTRNPIEPSLFWVYLFVLACSAGFAGCLYHAIKMGIIERQESFARFDPREPG